MAYTTIDKSSLHFNTKLYTGTGSSLALTGVGHQPDMVWQKVRSTTSSHRITDAVRGVGQVIYPNDTGQQSAESAVTAFGTDGFTVGTSGGTNTNGATYVGWSWKAGGGQGSSNTDGTINTTYTSVNTTAGFSISQWTGTGSAATIGHGLGSIPKIILMKKLSGSAGWVVYNHTIGAGKYLRLNTTDAEASDTNIFNNTAPTSSLFSVGTDADNNGSGATYVAYCFAEKTGFSKFGSYAGNGNADGGFLFCGFKPALVIIKKTTGADNWIMFDNKRDTDNVVGNYLFPNTNAANASGTYMDFVSNGFKLRTSDGWVNNGSHSYIFMAFAEAPLVGSNNVPATAR